MADRTVPGGPPVPDGGTHPGAPGRPGRVVAVVPLRDGTSGKSRLAHVLDPTTRSRLVAVLARHVVATLLASDGVERVVVVTSDPRFTWRALRDVVVDPATADDPDGPPLLTADADRVRIVLQPADRPGLNAAVDVGREVAAQDGPVRLLVTHADLPALSTDDVAALLAEDAPVVVATDRHRSGTNLLVVDADLVTSPSTTLVPVSSAERQQPRARQEAFAFRFGPDSRAAHLAEAERLGARAAVVHRPGTATDLDTLDDWGELPAPVRAAVGQQVPGLPPA
ncbi:2-phospho-L-lactate guanylyltransferase [Cellulosimicrobium marinum]|uniref:2-phospho-L-lactate guanylyltransferase n=1 Tax=Cellulosimicrobium marinum TaxID=1638992 RepID=UPI001E2978ED|nr:2-phospho-L-lactate guanylyltransferase [Cellulosimicrobium marinum]MCB7136338.1 2-phospho-L-lactate guanylyltransferase [Cellulosimicrobium marinum]